LEKLGGIKMSKKSKKKEEIKEEKIMEDNSIEEVNQNIEEVVESVENPIETIEEDVESMEEIVSTIEDGIENNEIIGKITGFEKLYVRKEANKDSEPVGIVSVEDDISIDINHSTDDFYKVITSNGLEGYCVKKFIKID
jgi:hypothetical protein